MAGNFKSFFFVLFLLTSLLFSISSAARPLNDIKGNSETKWMEVFLDGLNLEGIKTGGPSPGGKGHAFTVVVTNSGPSAGGKGHSFADAVTNSGPSSGGKGH
ncbi:hypothetical protein HRI_005202600 [Hibiscus trionum]|uniref:Uncharacterized protein n=1 Tax=Hibiscus trionum TaxID=183268 RepID=A0A9W7JKN4_HIBTR|nr:hypothetical protein HRI_005202600 [Hibiscus trionum]